MKRLLYSFFPALTVSGIVTVALFVCARPQSVITSASDAPPEIPPAAVGEAARPEAMVPQDWDRLGRWESMAGTAGQLLAVHVEIRELDLADFPAVCVDALRLKDAARHPLMRLLCIRWAELDGLAALHWVREQFREPKEGWRWSEMPKEIGSAWFAAQPAQASQWFSSLQKGARKEKEAWEPLIRGGPLGEWSGTGSAMAMAEAFIDRPGQLTGTAAGTEAFAAQISSTEEIAKLQEMLAEKGTEWPQRNLLPDGSIHTVNWKEAGLLIATAYEKAWPRIDPEGWRAYANEKVIGADGSHLLFQLVREDCRSAADAEAIAREFLQSPHASLVNAQEWGELARILEWRRTGSGMEFLTGVNSVAAAQALVQMARERNPGDLSGTMEMLQRLSDPATRTRAIEHALTTCSTNPLEAEVWLRNASLAPDEKEAIRELLVSRPIQRDQ